MEIEQKFLLEKKKNESLVRQNAKLNDKKKETKQAVWRIKQAFSLHYDYLLNLESQVRQKRREIDSLMNELSDLIGDL